MSYVGALASSQDGGSGSVVTLSLPAGCQADDHAYYVTTCNVGSTVMPTLPTGHDVLSSGSVGNNNTGVLAHRKLTSGDITAGTFTITYPSGNAAQAAGLVERGLDSATPNESVNAPDSAGGAAIVTTASATTVDGSAVLEFATSRAIAPAAADITFDASYTRVYQAATARASGANETAAVARRVQAMAGSVGGDTVSYTGNNGLVYLVALRAAPSVVTYNGAASLTGSGTLSASGVRAASDGATLTSGSSLSAAGTAISVKSATASLSAAETTSAASVVTRPAVLSLAASSILTVSAERAAEVTASLSSSASLAAASVVSKLGSVSMLATSAFAADGGLSLASESTLQASADLLISGIVDTPALADLTTESTLSSSSVVTGSALAAVEAVSALSASAVVIGVGGVGAQLSASAVLNAAATRAQSSDVPLLAVTSLSAAGETTAETAADLSAAGSLLVIGDRGVEVDAVLAASSTTGINATVIAVASVAMDTQSTLTQTADVTGPGAVQLASLSQLDALAAREAAALLEMAAHHVLTVAPASSWFGQAGLLSTASLTAYASVSGVYRDVIVETAGPHQNSLSATVQNRATWRLSGPRADLLSISGARVDRHDVTGPRS